ncbi:hypothetical protein RJT34_00569 [Clitoria ternatea]|uniref:FRIGIDA-like protein n=1 Tax=Clitoria ternatea TaxID=43366 RepID=A0AAN9KG54_CLITE
MGGPKKRIVCTEPSLRKFHFPPAAKRRRQHQHCSSLSSPSINLSSSANSPLDSQNLNNGHTEIDFSGTEPRRFEETELNKAFKDLQSHFDATHQTPKEANFLSNPNDPSLNPNDSSTGMFPQNFIVPGSVMPRYELSVLCEKMDGVGLRNYVSKHFKDRVRIRAELSGALRCAPDPAEMVLQALEGFHGVGDGLKDQELKKMKRSCIMVLSQFKVAALSVSTKARFKALKLALDWRERLMVDDASVLGSLVFIHLVSAFDLVSEFSVDELIRFSALAAVHEEFPELCRAVGLTDRVPDIVQKLLDRGKYILAVKYICEFNLADKIPPVSILKACVDESKKLSERLFQEGKSMMETTAREIHAVRSVMKIIKNHKLESEFPLASLEQHIAQLKRHKKNIKHPAPDPAAKPRKYRKYLQQQKRNMQKQKQKQQKSGIKRRRVSGPVGPAASVNSTIHHYYQQSLVHQGLFPKHKNSYMVSQAPPFGMLAPTQSFPPYTGPSAGPYGFDDVPMGLSSSGNPSIGGSYVNSSEPYASSGYYDRAYTYGGFGRQHLYQAYYYPQYQ